jgi:hypothetical protein
MNDTKLKFHCLKIFIYFCEISVKDFTKKYLHFYSLSLNKSEQNESKSFFVLKYDLNLVFILTTTHFETILKNYLQ